MKGVIQSVLASTLLASVITADLNTTTDCNFINVYPDDVCFKNPDADDQEKSRKFICVQGVPMRYDYADSENCSGDVEMTELDSDDVNYYCDADESCEYLKIESNAYTESDCDETDTDAEPEYTAENLRVVNKCVGNDEDTAYICNEAQDGFYECDCDLQCSEQSLFELDECDGQVVGSTENVLVMCPEFSGEVELATPSPVAPAGCNFYDETAMDACFEISSASELKSRKFVCDGNTPMRYTYSGSSDCSGDPDKMKDMSDEGDNYECGNDNACDYIVIETSVYPDSGSCKSTTYANSEARAIDACVGDGVVYKCLDSDNNFEVCSSCDDGGSSCSAQTSIEFDECQELAAGTASSQAALQRCAAPASLLNVYHMMVAVVVSLAVMAA